MATSADRCPIQPTPDTEHRYVALDTDDGDTIIYDRDIETAWMQSAFAIEINAMA